MTTKDEDKENAKRYLESARRRVRGDATGLANVDKPRAMRYIKQLRRRRRGERGKTAG